MNFRTLLLAAAAALALLNPSVASACACGCGLFDVGDGAVDANASASGLSIWFRYAYVNQDQNRELGSVADPADNPDKRIVTSFYTAGAEYRVSRKWTVMAELPLYQRRFTTTDERGGFSGLPGSPIVSERLTDLGDLLVKTTYTGLSSDLTTGFSLGLKLPTGRYTAPVGPAGGTLYDRDTLPGTGSTDVQFGGYHVGRVHGALNWFAQGQYHFAVATRGGYRPGNEFDGALGVNYSFGSVGPHRIAVTPTLQLLGALRVHDTGLEADPLNSGYQRLLIAPGLKLKLTRSLSVFGDIEVPVAQYVNSARSVMIEGTAGQLAAPVQFRVQVNYGF